MATLIPYIKNDFIKIDGKCNIKIRLSHDRKVRYLKTPYYTDPNLIGKDGRVKQRHPNYIELNAALTMLLNEYNSIITSIGPDVRFMAITTLMDKLRRNESNGAYCLINLEATNETGFSALPGSIRYDDGTFLTIGYYGYWWSSTENSSTYAYYRYMSCGTSNVYSYDCGYRHYGFSVRCLKD